MAWYSSDENGPARAAKISRQIADLGDLWADGAEVSRSRREDADFAALSSQRASADILQQAQVSIQSQANVNRSQALNLLS